MGDADHDVVFGHKRKLLIVFTYRDFTLIFFRYEDISAPHDAPHTIRQCMKAD